MIVTLVHVWIKQEYLEDFINATAKNQNNSIKEPGNLRFDILQDAEDPLKFTFYEAYISEEAVAAHKETEHYKTWREKVENWMAKPRIGVKHKVIIPGNIEAW